MPDIGDKSKVHSPGDDGGNWPSSLRLSYACRSPLLRPVPIGLIGPGVRDGACPPSVNLRMPICEYNSARAIVIRAWSVKPGRIYHLKCKGCVVEAVGVFVNEHPKHRRRGHGNGSKLAECGPRVVAVIKHVCAIQPRAINGHVWRTAMRRIERFAIFQIVKTRIDGADGLVHGEGACGGNGLANECGIIALIKSLAGVRRATEHLHVAAQIRNQQRAGRIGQDIGIKFLGLADAALAGTPIVARSVFPSSGLGGKKSL